MNVKTKSSVTRGRVSTLDYAIWPGWRLLMQDAGLETGPVLRRAKLPADMFSRLNVRLNSDDFFRCGKRLKQRQR